MSTNQKYLKDENGEIFSPIVSEDSIYDNNGKTLSKKLNDTGWRNFSWTNSTYMGTSQSSYTKNQWRVKNDILYIVVGVGGNIYHKYKYRNSNCKNPYYRKFLNRRF